MCEAALLESGTINKDLKMGDDAGPLKNSGSDFSFLPKYMSPVSVTTE